MPRYGTSDLDPLFVLDAELAKYSVAIVPRLTLPHQLAVPLDIPGKSNHGTITTIPPSGVDKALWRMIIWEKNCMIRSKTGRHFLGLPEDHLCD
jgi:hypothetical protein